MAADRVRVICGPTAAGKSKIAESLALEYGATIVSADSRQIYRGFDIGTAKPTWSERKVVRYQGIDICDPVERYSASDWASMARDALLANPQSLVVGGTGFYIRALFTPLFAAPQMNEAARERLADVLELKSTSELRRWCEVIDPARAHLGRTQLLRAIETAFLTGTRISDLHQTRAREPELAGSFLVIDPGVALAGRIESRIDGMIDAGWSEETRALDAAVPEGAPAWKASGYRTMREVSRGTLDLSAARERIIIETRQYAKRQRTWFRHQLAGQSVTRLNPDDADWQAVAERWWKETS